MRYRQNTGFQGNRSIILITILPFLLALGFTTSLQADSKKVDFNRDIRRILSNNCFHCHGPDDEDRKGGLRLDQRDAAIADNDGSFAIVPGKPDASDLIHRITTDDPDDIMPPVKSGKKISKEDQELLKLWISQGAPYAKHWAYVKPERPEVPKVKKADWPQNPIDNFILNRIEKESLAPAPASDRQILIRKLSLDLIGLPPTYEETQAYINDKSPNATEKLIDRLMARPEFGEHWSRMWLDLARYADSAGYGPDGPRTIWAYRDYVIKSFNQNKPFDTFTMEQLAGDLLNKPTQDQLVATAFHRNTQTNSEGGTVNEEFRNVAVVDRVNTTLSVWMGTTMACAQCHTHKYDPISQEEYFKFFSIFNQTADADLQNESPTMPIFTDKQKQEKKNMEKRLAELKQIIKKHTPETRASMTAWLQNMETKSSWNVLAANNNSISKSSSNLVEKTLNLSAKKINALQIEITGEKNKEVSLQNLKAILIPKENAKSLKAQYIRIEIPGKSKILSLAEVEVLDLNKKNIAAEGKAKQSSTSYGGHANLAIDKNTSGKYSDKTVTHSNTENNPWWELNLNSSREVSQVNVWNRIDNGTSNRLDGALVKFLDGKRKVVYSHNIKKSNPKNNTINLNGQFSIPFKVAYTKSTKPRSNIEHLIQDNKKSWTGIANKKHIITLIPSESINTDKYQSIHIKIKGNKNAKFSLQQVASTNSNTLIEQSKLPKHIFFSLKKPLQERNQNEKSSLDQYFLASVAKELNAPRKELASLEKKMKAYRPMTSVPVLKELDQNKRRKTHIQLRGSYLAKGKEVSPGFPEHLFPYKTNGPINRITAANWLMHQDNPLTARVTVNRYWEKLFGKGIVETSEEFGSQGNLPTHPELLDWLSVELIEKKWDLKHLIKLLVSTAAYQQTSKLQAKIEAKDPENYLVSRGPRFRLTAEMVRDQALSISGLLSKKMYGPPVQPPQPNLGVKASFGGSVDWKTSTGEDRYRRAIYTKWRRSNPYPSMVTFDAPNREVCVVRRDSTNTPLQALVTLNDPVYIEAAQALARRSIKKGRDNKSNILECFQAALTRDPIPAEMDSLIRLYQDTYKTYSQDMKQAVEIATNPLGKAPEGSDIAQLAAMTIVSNVLLNLDEVLMKR